MNAFVIPRHLIVKETENWLVNHRVDSALPGYLMVSSKTEASDLSQLSLSALTEMGPLLASTQRAIMDSLRPEHIYVGRYGHQPGHSLHFHFIPIYSWVKAAFSADARYGILKTFYSPGGQNSEFDGAELTLFVWREFCESRKPPQTYGPTVAEAVSRLSKAYARERE